MDETKRIVFEGIPIEVSIFNHEQIVNHGLFCWSFEIEFKIEDHFKISQFLEPENYGKHIEKCRIFNVFYEDSSSVFHGILNRYKETEGIIEASFSCMTKPVMVEV